MTQATPLTIETDAGTHLGQYTTDGVLQIHIFQPARGSQPPLFAVYAIDDLDVARREIGALLDGEQLPHDANVTSRLTSAIAAGTGARISKVEFGQPGIQNKTAA